MKKREKRRKTKKTSENRWFSRRYLLRQRHMEAAPRIELGMRVLQTRALPLGYAAECGAEDEIRIRDFHLGKVALYH